MNTTSIASQMLAAVGPSLQVGAAMVVAFALSVFTIALIKARLEVAVKRVKEEKIAASLARKNAGSFSWALQEQIDEDDAQKWIDDFEGRQAFYDDVMQPLQNVSSVVSPHGDVYSSAWVDGWRNEYVKQAVANGASYSDAVMLVDREERDIESALSYVHRGFTADEAIAAVERDASLGYGEVVDVYTTRDGRETYEYAGSMEEAVGELPTEAESKADIRARYERGALHIPAGFHWNDQQGFIERDFAERVA